MTQTRISTITENLPKRARYFLQISVLTKFIDVFETPKFVLQILGISFNL